MSRLLSANFRRLVKSKIFWQANLFMVGYSVFVYVMAYTNSVNELLNINWSLYFFNDMILMGFVMAIFTAFFLETEYRDGTIRNKIVVGHSRKNIFLSNLITCFAAGIVFEVVYILTSAIVGTLLIGPVIITSVNNVCWRVVCSVLIVMEYSSLFVFISMLDSNKARSAAVSILAAMLLLIAGLRIYNDLQQPELTSRTVMSETGEFKVEENIPNSNYVRGTKRVIWEALSVILPSARSLSMITAIDMDGVFSALMPICSIVISVFICGLGMYIFQKKDIV